MLNTKNIGVLENYYGSDDDPIGISTAGQGDSGVEFGYFINEILYILFCIKMSSSVM